MQEIVSTQIRIARYKLAFVRKCLNCMLTLFLSIQIFFLKKVKVKVLQLLTLKIDINIKLS